MNAVIQRSDSAVTKKNLFLFIMQKKTELFKLLSKHHTHYPLICTVTRFASQFDVEALIFTSRAAFTAPCTTPASNSSERLKAAANLFRQRTVLEGLSIVTSAAASPER